MKGDQHGKRFQSGTWGLWGWLGWGGRSLRKEIHMGLWDSAGGMGCWRRQLLHLEKVERDPSNALVPFIESEAPGI